LLPLKFSVSLLDLLLPQLASAQPVFSASLPISAPHLVASLVLLSKLQVAKSSLLCNLRLSLRLHFTLSLLLSRTFSRTSLLFSLALILNAFFFHLSHFSVTVLVNDWVVGRPFLFKDAEGGLLLNLEMFGVLRFMKEVLDVSLKGSGEIASTVGYRLRKQCCFAVLMHYRALSLSN
jgi:hypothetical protein